MMRKLLRFLLWLALIGGAFVGLLRLTALRWWRVPDNDPWLQASVMPTLNAGDWVVLWRLTSPSDGDLVLCPEPGAPERVVVGRLMARGGDEIEIGGSTVTVNDRGFGTERSCGHFEVVHPRSGRAIEQTCSIEDLDGRLHPRGNANDPDAVPTPLPKVSIAPGKVFLVSDNRQLPFDSRDYGPVDAASCKETIVFRLWGSRGFFDASRRFDVIR